MCCAVPLCTSRSPLRCTAGEPALTKVAHSTPPPPRFARPRDHLRCASADNGGIYAILAQFLIVAVVTGVLCFAAPASTSAFTDACR